MEPLGFIDDPVALLDWFAGPEAFEYLVSFDYRSVRKLNKSVSTNTFSGVHMTENDDDRLAKGLGGAGHGKSNSFVFAETPYLSC